MSSVLLCAALCGSLALPSAPSPPQSAGSPLRCIRERLQEHEQVLARARQLAAEEGTDKPSGAPGSAVSWDRLRRELRTTQQLRFVLPASLISLVLSAVELLTPRLQGKIFDAVLLPGTTFSSIAPGLRALALLALGTWLGSIASATLFASARWASCMSARVRLMEAILAQESRFFDGQQPGELASRLLSEPDRLEELANRGLEKALNAALALAGGFALMLATEWRLAVLAVSLRAPLLGKLAVVAGRTVGLYGVAQQHAVNDANALAAEALAQPEIVAAFDAHCTVLEGYRRRVRDYMEVIRVTLLSETVLRFTRLAIDSAATQLMLVAGLACVLRGTLSLGSLLAFGAYSDMFARGCTATQDVVSALSTMRPACSRYFALLDRVPTMAHGVGVTPEECTGDLELHNVSFAFPGRARDAIRRVSLRVPAGSTLAIVGPSGAGKSTLLKLLLRLFDPDEGAITLDGRDVRELELGWLRRRFGYVPQLPVLFDGTVAENIALGLEAPPTEGVLRAAAAAAEASSLVASLPGGLHARVGEGGRALSGGQRQRLAIARALVREPAVLLWDEATSSLDAGTERAVQDALRQLGGQRTAIVVAHRLSSVVCADHVAVLCDGRVVELGTPTELATAGGWFERNFYPEGE